MPEGSLAAQPRQFPVSTLLSMAHLSLHYKYNKIRQDLSLGTSGNWGNIFKLMLLGIEIREVDVVTTIEMFRLLAIGTLVLVNLMAMEMVLIFCLNSQTSFIDREEKICAEVSYDIL